MRTIIEVYQYQADECARLAKETDDPELRKRFLKLADEWMQAIKRGSHDSRGRVPRASTYNRPERRRRMSRPDSAEAVGAISGMGREPPTAVAGKSIPPRGA
jgi:hypothetical protein